MLSAAWPNAAPRGRQGQCPHELPQSLPKERNPSPCVVGASVRRAATENLHYLIGRNCWDLSWVTQLGTRAFQHPHHRPSAADNIAAPWPGLLSGGPNSRPADPAGLALPKRPPMQMYKDDEAAYSMNEIAINWNAPLVFLLASLHAD